MRRRGSVTVTFSLVFLLMFSFILAFFEMAAYTARSAYHAAAAQLAVENYFAAYTAPLFEKYHIFGREIPAGEELRAWSEEEIAADVLYMTQKKEGQHSLLLRSGADFSLDSVETLTQKDARGFYDQAVRAMQYRSVSEIADLVKRYLNLSKQMECSVTVIAQQAEVAEAYAVVENEILKLIELVDGVKLSAYELYLRQKATKFQADYYVKHFCTLSMEAAEAYFDRAEVYQSFCLNYENPFLRLVQIEGGVRLLAEEMEEREKKQASLGKEKEEAAQLLSEYEKQLSEYKKQKAEMEKYRKNLTKELDTLQKKSEKSEAEKERIAVLLKLLQDVDSQTGGMENKMQELALAQKPLEERIKEIAKQEKELSKLLAEQKKEQKRLQEDEKQFLKVCSEVGQTCVAAAEEAGVIKEELQKAIAAKENCNQFLASLTPVLGEEAVRDYAKELEKYQMYESAGEYDFDRIEQTLSSNRAILDGMSVCITGEGSAALYASAARLQQERKSVRAYSFEGLRLNYGEISLEGSVKNQALGILQNAVSNSFLGLLTEKEISNAELETDHLPSGFQFAGKEAESILSLLKKDFRDIMGEISKGFSEEGELAKAAQSVAEPLLFHAYLVTHFEDYSRQKEHTALNYELEYLIGGCAGDAENLSLIMTKIVLFRMALHFVSLYSDSTRRAAAEAAALAVCGGIGLPALQAAALFVFLLIWSAEEALIDAAALLEGKRLAIFPRGENASLEFFELLQFSKAQVRKKAKEKKDAAGIGFVYRDFLQLYLLMTPKEYKCFRAMDLIQENMRSWYKKSFRMKRCVWRVKYRTDQRNYQYSYCD